MAEILQTEQEALAASRSSEQYRADREAQCRQEISLNPNKVDALNSLAGLLRADDHAEKESLYRKVLSLDSKNLWALINLGDLLSNDWAFNFGDLINDTERHNEAEVLYRQAISLYPKNLSVWDSLGDLLSKNQERHADAEAAYRQGISLTASRGELLAVEFWNKLGLLLSRDNLRRADAEAAFRHSIRIHPESTNIAWEGLVELLGIYGNLTLAIKQTTNLLKRAARDRDPVRALEVLSDARKAQNNFIAVLTERLAILRARVQSCSGDHNG